MSMNCKSAIMWGVIAWVLIFVAISVIMFAPQLKDNISAQRTLELIAVPIISAFAAYMYFGKEKPSTKDGAMLGLCFIVVSVVLDLLVTIPLFTVPAGMSAAQFFTQWNLLAGFAETIIAGALVGYYLGKRK